MSRTGFTTSAAGLNSSTTPFNDSGWDLHGFAPHSGGTLEKFDALGMVQTEGGKLRPMTADELEKTYCC
jgi:hypothetical protein